MPATCHNCVHGYRCAYVAKILCTLSCRLHDDSWDASLCSSFKPITEQ